LNDLKKINRFEEPPREGVFWYLTNLQ